MGKTARSMLLVSGAVLVAGAGLLACGSPPPPKPVEMVPANAGDEPEKKNDATTTSGATDDPSASAGSGKPAPGGTNAMPQKIDNGGGAAPTPSGGAAAPAAPVVAGATGPKVTKAECKKALEKYVDLAIAGNPDLAGVPPEVIKQAFTQAAAQSANPCDGDGVTRNQYKCAMKATTTDAWQTCMK